MAFKQYKASADGYLSDVCMHIKAGQIVEFPEGHLPKIDTKADGNWLWPIDEYPDEKPMVPLGALPVVSEAKPKAHEHNIVRPEYDDQMAHIVAAEAVQDAGKVQPDVAAAINAAQPLGTVTPTTPTEQQGTGNKDVI